MLNIYLVTRLLFRDRAGLNALGIAAFGMLVVNPRTLFEASFQLTFLSVIAVAGIAVPVLRSSIYPLQTGLKNLDSPNYDYSFPTKAAQFRSDLRLIRSHLAAIVGNPVANFITTRAASVVLAAAELVIGSFIIQFALTLPMAWYFHRVTTLSLPANALVIPIVGILLPTAVVAVALSYVSAWLAWIPTQITSYSLDLLTGTVRLFGHLRLSNLRVPTPGLAMCFVAAAAFCVALLLARRGPIQKAIGLAALALAAFALVLLPPKPQLRTGVLEITAVDVGQGDSLLIVTPEGKTLLMGLRAGWGATSRSDFDVGEEVVSPYLWSRGIRRLDVVAASIRIRTTSEECAASLPTSGRASFGTDSNRDPATSSRWRRRPQSLA